MARKLRIQDSGPPYQVMNRGDRRECIFEDDRDRQRFLETLARAGQKTGGQAQAYCVLSNHTLRYKGRHKEFGICSPSVRPFAEKNILPRPEVGVFWRPDEHGS